MSEKPTRQLCQLPNGRYTEAYVAAEMDTYIAEMKREVFEANLTVDTERELHHDQVSRLTEALATARAALTEIMEHPNAQFCVAVVYPKDRDRTIRVIAEDALREEPR